MFHVESDGDAAIVGLVLADDVGGAVGRGVPAAELEGALALVAMMALAQTPANQELAWIELKRGLRYADLEVGEGAEARPGRTLQVHYTGWLEDGTLFQASRDSGRAFVFKLGAGQVIAGWEQGVRGMRPGGRRRLLIPPKLAYGRKGAGSLVPPNATLTFEIELLSVQ